jgi:hypothetical protein
MAEQSYATIADKKFLNSTGVGHLWEKIRDRYDSKLDSVSAADDSIVVTGGDSIGVQISAAEGNLLELKTANGQKGLYVPTPAAADTYAITKDATSSDYAAVYRLKKYANGVGEGVDAGVTINIPKDMVVSSGTVVTKSESGAWGAAGTYIELTLANASSDKLYIAVDDLIEYVTSGSTSSDMVQIAIDANHQVTATIKAGSITTTELDSSIVTSLGLADSAVQSISTGATNGTISVDGTEVAVAGLGTAAYTASTAYDASGAAAAVLGTNEDSAGTVTVYGVKKYASDVYESIVALSNNEIDAAIAAANSAIDNPSQGE